MAMHELTLGNCFSIPEDCENDIEKLFGYVSSIAKIYLFTSKEEFLDFLK